MNLEYINSFVSFKKRLHTNQKLQYILGQINAHLYDLSNIAILPSNRVEILRSNLENSKDIFRSSKTENLTQFLRDIYKENFIEQKPTVITPDLVSHLSLFFDTGDENNKSTAHEKLMSFCEFVRKEFDDKPIQHPEEAILNAVETGLMFECCQPYSSNSGISRLLEYIMLTKVGIPNLLSFLLATHYHQTRAEYQKQLQAAMKNHDIMDFMEYSFSGFHNGLRLMVRDLQAHQLLAIWKQNIDEQLAKDPSAGASVTGRRKELVLSFPLASEGGFTFEEITVLTTRVAKVYARKTKTARRDVAALVEAGLLSKRGRRYHPNLAGLLGEFALKSTIVKSEVIKGKEIRYSHHALPTITAVELKSELLETLTNL